MACLTANQLSEYVEGVLPETEREAVEDELARCDDCRALLCDWAQTTLRSGPLSPALAAERQPDASATGFRRGDRLEGFELIDYLGAGGMGMVFSARDTELDRDVAIKVVHPQLVPSAAAAGDLLSEARAMAAVKHPNVVRVYSAGRVGDRSFIAMERIEGAALPNWMAEKRSATEVAGLFLGVARGLAAIHETGFVHRDVKPSNVLVEDGAGKLSDFGLASRDATTELVGTPAFMAPEVKAGGEATPASDQFSFCLTVKAVWSDPPRAIAGVLERGLRSEPARRWPSMATLGIAIERAAQRPQRWLQFGALGAAIAVAAAGMVWQIQRENEKADCGDPKAGLDDLWTASARASVRLRFEQTGRPWASKAFSRIDVAMGDAITRWRGTRHGSCVESAIGKQSSETAESRSICLDRVAVRLGATQQNLAAADGATVDAAASIAQSLADPFACNGREPRSNIATPAAAALAAAELHNKTGRYSVALAALADLDSVLSAIGEPRLLARHRRAVAAAERRGQRYKRAADALAESARFAAEANDARLLASVHRDLALVVGYYQDQPDAGSAHLTTASTWAAKVGDPRIDAAIEDARGLIASSRGDHAAALAAFASSLEIRTRVGDELGRAESLYLRGLIGRQVATHETGFDELSEALAIRRRELGVAHPDVFRVYNALGLVVGGRGDLSGALAWFERGVREAEAFFGADDPELAVALNSLGTHQLHSGKYDDAQETLERTLAIRRRVLAPDDVDLMRTLVNLASLHYYRGSYETAREHYREALRIASESFGANHAEVGVVARGLGLAALAAGDVDQAHRHIQRSVNVARVKGAPLELADALGNLAMVEAKRKRWQESLKLVGEGLALQEGVVGDDHPRLAYAFTMLAEIHYELGEYERAKASIERALRLRLEGKVAPQLVAENRFVLARILWRLGKRNAARAQARAAVSDLGSARPELKKMIAAWLRSPS